MENQRTLQQAQEELSRAIYEAGALAIDIENFKLAIEQKRQQAAKLKLEVDDLRSKIKNEIDKTIENAKT